MKASKKAMKRLTQRRKDYDLMIADRNGNAWKHPDGFHRPGSMKK